MIVGLLISFKNSFLCPSSGGGGGGGGA